MNRLTVMPFLLAMFAAIVAMPTNVYQVCAWNVGTLEVEAWRSKASAAFRSAREGIRMWLARLFTPRVAFACLAVLLAILAAHFSAGHDGVLLAIAPVAQLKTKRADLMTKAAGLKRTDGTFADDQARSAFDATMTEVEQIDEQIRQVEATPPPAAAPASAPPSDVTDAARAATEAERARVIGIQEAVRIAKLPDTFAADLVKRGVSLDEARAAIFVKLAEAQRGTEITHHPEVVPGQDAAEKFQRGAVNWLLVKGGMADMVARASKVDVSTIDPGEFRGFSLLDLARLCLERSGRRVVGLDKMRLVAEAFTTRGTITQSTSDFAVLLENTMHKVLQLAYAITPDSWSLWCNRSTVTDFRAHNRYRMGSFGSLDTVGENGEFKNKGISDAEKASIQASTKGNIINVSRQMIVNDDVNFFSRLPELLGRAAALSVEVDAYALLGQNSGLGPTQSDAQPLFHANRSNVGTGAAISASSLDADAAVMAAQKDPNGNEFLALEPAVLLVPRTLKGQAIVINESQYDPDTLANKSQMKPNLARGFFRTIVGTPRLTGTRRYFFADPALYPVFEVAFLEGQTAPVLESQDGWRTDGAEMKVRFDYGVAAVDFRGAVTNAGA